MKKSNVLNKKSMRFLETYLNNPSPTGYEWEGQKIWMDYLKPYVDTFITDTYGTAVGVINPDASFKVVIEAQYANMKRNADAKWIDIHVDVGARRARRIIERLKSN